MKLSNSPESKSRLLGTSSVLEMFELLGLGTAPTHLVCWKLGKEKQRLWKESEKLTA